MAPEKKIYNVTVFRFDEALWCRRTAARSLKQAENNVRFHFFRDGLNDGCGADCFRFSAREEN